MMLGRIVCEYGQTLRVISQGRIYECFARKNIDSCVIGDEVEFEWNEAHQQGVITGRLPRRNMLCRSDRYHPIKEMAANIDQIVILFASLPLPNEYYLDQYLVASELARIPALLVLNKADLLSSAENKSDLLNLAAYCARIGYPVLQISAKTGAGIDEFLGLLCDKTSFLLGSSGVGKSSLVNALMQGEPARIAEVSKATGKGQHTTSVSMLYRLPHGGAIIDVPGIRELNLPLEYKSKIAHGFREFAPYLSTCRFRNCSHRDDPDCAIVAQVKAGNISETRLKNYYRMTDRF